MMNISLAMDIAPLLKTKQILDPETRAGIDKYVRHQLCYERSQRAEFRSVLDLAIELNADPEQQKDPIHVTTPDAGSFGDGLGLEVSIGQKRFLAFVLMSAKTIRAKRVTYDSLQSRLDIELREHFKSESLPASDMVIILRTATRLGNRFFTVSEISEITGKGRGTAHQLHQLIDADNYFAERIRSGEFRSLTAMVRALKECRPSPDRPFKCFDANDLYQASRTIVELNGTAEDAHTYFMLMMDLLSSCRAYNEIHLSGDQEHPESVRTYLETTKVALDSVETSLLDQIDAYTLGREQGRYVFDRHKAQACMNVLTLCKERMIERMNLFSTVVRKQRLDSPAPSAQNQGKETA